MDSGGRFQDRLSRYKTGADLFMTIFSSIHGLKQRYKEVIFLFIELLKCSRWGGGTETGTMVVGNGEGVNVRILCA